MSFLFYEDRLAMHLFYCSADKIFNNHRLEELLSKRDISYKGNKITVGSTALVNYIESLRYDFIKMENSCIKKEKHYSKSIVHIHLEIILVPTDMLYYYCSGQLLQSEAFCLYVQTQSVRAFSDLRSGTAHWDLFYEVYASVA